MMSQLIDYFNLRRVYCRHKITSMNLMALIIIIMKLQQHIICCFHESLIFCFYCQLTLVEDWIKTQKFFLNHSCEKQHCLKFIFSFICFKTFRCSFSDVIVFVKWKSEQKIQNNMNILKSFLFQLFRFTTTCSKNS